MTDEANSSDLSSRADPPHADRPRDLSDELEALNYGAVEAVLEAQRAEHTSDDDPGASERADDGMAPLINNTGDDGDAPSG
jgi:hypothetical protein